MARFEMEDGTVVDTKNASDSWEEDRYFDGNNMISRATGGQWTHEKLYRSRKGRYYIVHSSQWQGSRDHAEWVSPEAATRWILKNHSEIPEDLQKYVEAVTE